MDSFAIQVQQLDFRYPGQINSCFENLNFQIEVGARLGFFGPNGAGKTTFMGLLTSLLPYEIGSIQVFGKELKNNKSAIKRQFGFVPQDFSFYQELTPTENLAFFGAWSGLSRQESRKRTDELLQVLDLTEVANKPVHTFSGGMKRKVNLAIGVIHQPKLLLLDEPTVGVDVQSRQVIIAYLKELNANGTTLLYTSHQLAEAEELCDTVALINKGKILAHDKLNTVLESYAAVNLENLFVELAGKKIGDSDE